MASFTDPIAVAAPAATETELIRSAQAKLKSGAAMTMAEYQALEAYNARISANNQQLATQQGLNRYNSSNSDPLGVTKLAAPVQAVGKAAQNVASGVADIGRSFANSAAGAAGLAAGTTPLAQNQKVASPGTAQKILNDPGLFRNAVSNPEYNQRLQTQATIDRANAGGVQITDEPPWSNTNVQNARNAQQTAFNSQPSIGSTLTSGGQDFSGQITNARATGNQLAQQALSFQMPQQPQLSAQQIDPNAGNTRDVADALSLSRGLATSNSAEQTQTLSQANRLAQSAGAEQTAAINNARSLSQGGGAEQNQAFALANRMATGPASAETQTAMALAQKLASGNTQEVDEALALTKRLATEPNAEADRALALTMELYNRIIEAPSQVRLAGEQNMAQQLALARSARGGAGAVQDALNNAQGQAPLLAAQIEQMAIAEEQQRNQALNQTVSTNAGITNNLVNARTQAAGANASLAGSAQASRTQAAGINADIANNLNTNRTQAAGISADVANSIRTNQVQAAGIEADVANSIRTNQVAAAGIAAQSANAMRQSQVQAAQTFAGVASQAADRQVQIQIANQNAATQLQTNLVALSGQQVQFTTAQMQTVGQLARDYFNSANELAGLSVQQQTAQWDAAVRAYGIDKQFDATMRSIAAQEGIGPLDALKIALGIASSAAGV